jgi:hypothetical protein
MKHWSIIRMFATLSVFLACLPGGHPAAATQAPFAMNYHVYLPTIAASGTPNPPTPIPQPRVPFGFFTMTDWLTYSAATAVDVNGGIHLALFVSDERHQDQPLNQPALYILPRPD